MTRVLADYEDLAMASNDLALVAHFLDRRTYLHSQFPFGYASIYVHTQPQVIDAIEIPSDGFLKTLCCRLRLEGRTKERFCYLKR